MNGSFKIRAITYPIEELIWRFALPEFIFFATAYLDVSKRSGYTIITFAWPVVFYFFAQYSYIRIIFFNDRLKIEFIASLYLKNKEILFSEVESAFFQFSSGRYTNPFIIIRLKGSKKKITINMPKHELEQIKYELKDSIIKIRIAKDRYDRSSNYFQD